MNIFSLYTASRLTYMVLQSSGGFPGGSDGKESTCNAGDPGSIPGPRRSPGEGNGNPLQYSFLGNPMARGAWQATIQGVTNSWTQLSTHTHTQAFIVCDS